MQPGQVILNKYEVVRPLGAGHFGQVFQVFNRNLQQHSALKVVFVEDPAAHRAVVEAQAMSLCGHDHVVKILTADVFESHVLIEMEYIDGGSLGDRLIREFVPVVDSINYVKQILFALEFAHSRGFIHRDVKPGNIMLAPRYAKLSDFGTAIHSASGIAATDLFYRPHASPEAVNNNEFSPLSDVYAAGMTLQRAANNRAMWGELRNDQAAFRQDILNGKLASRLGYAPWVPRALKTVLNRACANDLSKRFQSAVAFRQALEGLKLVRPWVRVSVDEWICEHDGKLELLRYVPKQHRVEYFINGRRKLKSSKTYTTEREARQGLERTVAEFTSVSR
nr:serine/threonine-protein kinase [Bradyrhizobium liaoningense]